MKRFFRRIFHKHVRQMFLLGILAVIGVFGYLHWWGVPGWIKNAVASELAKRGIDADIRSLTFDPWRGMVAENVLVKVAGAERLQFKADEIRLELNTRALLKRKVVVDDLEFIESVLSVELQDETGAPVPVEIRNVNGTFAFDAEQTLIIRNLNFKLLDVAFDIRGSLGTKQETPAVAAERKPIILSKPVMEVYRKLQQMRSPAPVVAEVKLSGDLQNKDSLRAVLRFRGRDVQYDKFLFQQAQGEIVYRDRAIRVDPLTIRTGDGSLDVRGRYELDTKNAAFDVSCHAKPAFLASLLPTDKKQWLAGLEGSQPLSLEATGLTPGGDWKACEIAGKILARDFSWRGVPFKEVQLKGEWRNGKAEVPEIFVAREEGKLRGHASWDSQTDECRFSVDSSINLDDLEPIFPEKTRNAFKTFTLTTPPVIQITGTRKLKDPASLKAAGSVEIKDFTGNAIEIRSFRCKLEAAGDLIKFTNVEARKKEGKVTGNFSLNTATGDLNIKAQSDVYPVDIATIIGPKTKASLESYHFKTPPKISWSGVYNLRQQGLTDLKIDVACSKFNWWKLNISGLRAKVWVGPQSIEITDVTGAFHSGKIQANILVDLTSKPAKVGFHVNVNDADFRTLNEELFGYKQVDGRLTGHAWAAGLTGLKETWVGSGWLKIEDGELWRIPIFGDLSKVLGTIIPGFGAPKARYAETKFDIRDAYADMDDIKIDSLIVTLTAKGKYYFDQRLDFIVQGHLLRKLFFVGWFLDPITKIAELKLTGTLSKWEWKTAYLPIPGL